MIISVAGGGDGFKHKVAHMAPSAFLIGSWTGISGIRGPGGYEPAARAAANRLFSGSPARIASNVPPGHETRAPRRR